MQSENSNYTDNVELLCKDIIALCKASINQDNHSFLNTSNLNVNLRRLNDIIKNNVNINFLEKIIIFFANIEKKAEIDLNRCLYMNMNLLCYAIKYSYFKVAEVLIKARVDVNAKDINGNRPLHIATLPLNIMVANHVDDEFLENHQIIKLLIDQGARINVYNKEGITPLHNICQRGDFKMIKFLEKNDANFDVYDFRGNNLLFYSVSSDRELKVIQYLIEKKNVDVNSNNKKMQNVLFHLIKSYKLFRSDTIIKIIKYLVKKGININACDNNGNNPLFYAVKHNTLHNISDIIRYFISLKVNIDVPNNHGETSLFYAALKGNIPLIKLLIREGANINAHNNDGETPLFYAIKQGHFKVVEFLLKQQVEYEFYNNNGETPLDYARSLQKDEIVELFLSIQKDTQNNLEFDKCVSEVYHDYKQKEHSIHSTDSIEKIDQSSNELMIAIKKNFFANEQSNEALDKQTIEENILKNTKEITEWINKGINVNFKDSYGDTLLIKSVEKLKFTLVKILIKNGANVNLYNNIGVTALWRIFQNASLENNSIEEKIAKYLIENGAKVNHFDINGMSMLHLAVQTHNIKFFHYLLKNGAKINVLDKNRCSVLFAALDLTLNSFEKLNFIKFLSTQNLKFNATNAEGETPLFYAIQKGDLEIIKFLTKEKGAMVNAYNYNNETPLFYAIKQGNLEIIIFLIEEAGAFVNVCNKQGETPLFYAVQTNNIAIVEYLITNKANVSACDQEGETASFDAVRQENIEIIRLLLLQDPTSVNIFNNKQQNLLCIANIQGNPIIINFLSELIINIDSCNNQENNIESKKLLTMYNTQESISVPLELTKQITANSEQLDQGMATTNPKLHLT